MLQPKEINERIGIPNTAGDSSQSTSALILGVLRHLQAEGRVSHTYHQGTYKWQISEKEAKVRKAWK